MNAPTWFLPAFGAMFVWGFWGFFPKLASAYLHPTHALVYEVLGGVLVGVILWWSLGFKLDYHPKGSLFSFLAGATALCGGLLYMHACSRGPVVPIVILTALYPVWTVLLAWIVLGEQLSWRQALGALLAGLSILLLVG